MTEYIIIGILIFSIPFIVQITFKKGIQKGMNDFLKLLLVNGFNSKINAFKKQNAYVKPGGIVFLGDSITQDFNVYEYFTGLNVYNRGIGGDTTEGLLTRLDVSVFDLNPAKVSILIGTNDFALLNTSPKEIYERILEVIKKIKLFDPQIDIILQSVYPVNSDLSPMTVLPRQNSGISKLNDMLKQVEEVTYVDLYSLLVDSNQKLNPMYTVEGLHINEQGYELIAKSLMKFIND